MSVGGLFQILHKSVAVLPRIRYFLCKVCASQANPSLQLHPITAF